MRVYMTIRKDGVDTHRIECEFIDACAVGRGAVAEGYTLVIEPIPPAIEGQPVTGEVVD